MPEPTSPPGADGKAPAHSTPPLVASIPGTLIALATAIGGAFTAYQGYQESQALNRASYEATKRAVEEHTEALLVQSRTQTELRAWAEAAIERIERRQAAVDKVLARKPKPPPAAGSASRPSTPPTPTVSAVVTEPTPKPPPPPPEPTATALPPFDALETKP